MSDSIQRSAAVLYQMEEETPGLKESAQALVSDTMLWPALNGTGATREEKEELIRTAPMLAGKEQLTAFVLLLLEQGTLDSLPAILRELRQLELAAQGGAVCVVTCARQPDEATLEDLRRRCAACGDWSVWSFKSRSTQPFWAAFAWRSRAWFMTAASGGGWSGWPRASRAILTRTARNWRAW